LWLADEIKVCIYSEFSPQDLKDADIPRAKSELVEVKVIAGESMGVKSPVRTRTPIFYLHVKIRPGGKFVQTIPAGYNAFAYVITGVGKFGASGTPGSLHTTLVLSNPPEQGESEFSVTSDETEGLLEFLLVGGVPIDEPIVQHGPFVMNTTEEIYEAFDDFQFRRNGFENAGTWKSKNSRRMGR
jgi:redox-sensitive bicupin YhaK (pirin superfamily)